MVTVDYLNSTVPGAAPSKPRLRMLVAALTRPATCLSMAALEVCGTSQYQHPSPWRVLAVPGYATLACQKSGHAQANANKQLEKCLAPGCV